MRSSLPKGSARITLLEQHLFLHGEIHDLLTDRKDAITVDLMVPKAE